MQEKSVLRLDEIPGILSARYGFSVVSVVAPLSGGSANLWTVSCDGKLENDYSSLLSKAENLDSEIRDLIVPDLEFRRCAIAEMGDLNLVTYFEFPALAGDTWLDYFGPLFADSARVGERLMLPVSVITTV